ncbi:DUF6624 domain-containing protein [Nitrospirillum pindoramense]|uniref:DUF6624 domain-containing protein n=1 Tax=Nitrospirillum amazonense TaxID=28077 RepID=UPI0011A2F4F1|nr:DUF6624 domain-containing protein [Nitrospirillum amazonense]
MGFTRNWVVGALILLAAPLTGTRAGQSAPVWPPSPDTGMVIAGRWMDQAEQALDHPPCDLADRICATGVHGFAHAAVDMVAALSDCVQTGGCQADMAALEARTDALEKRAKAVDARLEVISPDFATQDLVDRWHMLPTAETAERLWRRVRGDVERDACPPTQPLCVEGELLALWAADQISRSTPNCFALDGQARQACMIDMVRRVGRVDAFDQGRLRHIMAAIGGWPDALTWGSRASQMAWLIVQHADPTPAFQRHLLPVIKSAVDAGRTPPAHYAYLYDRVAVKKAGGRQLYGTQGRCDDKSHTWGPDPVADPAHLDQRRVAIGLTPEADYQAQLNRVCRGELH